MGIKANFSRASVQNALAKKEENIRKVIIRNLLVLGQKAVNMSKDAIGIDPAGFPINYGTTSTKSPLKQRIISDAERVTRGSKTGKNPVFGDYLDDTENLRESIGCGVYYNGALMESEFEAGNSLSLANSVAPGTGFALVVVAGMDYAMYVESKGYNVITSSEIWMINEFQAFTKRIAETIKKAK